MRCKVFGMCGVSCGTEGVEEFDGIDVDESGMVLMLLLVRLLRLLLCWLL